MRVKCVRVGQGAFIPAAKLVGRLKYWQKFVLIGFVLIAPLAYVVLAYLGVQNRDTAFAAREQVGVVYVRPATELLSQVVSARAIAVQVAAHQANASALDGSRSQVNSAIAQVDAVHGAAATLALNRQWVTLRQQIGAVIAAAVTTAPKALAEYDGLTRGIESLIAADGNNSNMILDPDNDSYYVMDAVLNRLTVLMDSAGQAGDLQTVIAASGMSTLAKRLTLEDLKGTILTTLANSDPDYASALANTHDPAMKPRLTGPLATFDSSVKAVTTQLSSAVEGRLDGATASGLAATEKASAMALNAATLPVIDHLLAARIDGFDSSATRTEAIALMAVLIALYLFVGFYLSVRRSQDAILEGLQGLADNCTDPLAEGLDAMATGDLTRRVDPDTPVVAQVTQDELGNVVVAVNAIRERVISSITSFNSMVDQLRSMLGNVSRSAGAISAASQQMASTSEEAGRATSEIAQAVSDVALGAERQVTMIDDARHAVEEVAQAVAESAHTAQLTTDVAVEARQAVGDGLAAAGKANEAMRSVRESSTAVTSAIGELASKSQQIGAIVQTITAIAQQTNLLALNAAIEAARAGEHGHGFAVVAEEVRKLAEESQHAAAEIGDLINTIQVETTNTVGVVQDGAKLTEEGAVVVQQTREAFERIGSSVDDMAGRVEQIAAVSKEVAASASKMQDSISEIAAVAEQSSASTEQVSASTDQTSASTKQIAAAAHELASTAETLEQLVAKFRLTT